MLRALTAHTLRPKSGLACDLGRMASIRRRGGRASRRLDARRRTHSRPATGSLPHEAKTERSRFPSRAARGLPLYLSASGEGRRPDVRDIGRPLVRRPRGQSRPANSRPRGIPNPESPAPTIASGTPGAWPLDVFVRPLDVSTLHQPAEADRPSAIRVGTPSSHPIRLKRPHPIPDLVISARPDITLATPHPARYSLVARTSGCG
jgi:hypothetical protein